MFYERIKELRISLKMNQVEFGRKIGVSKQCVSNWENAYIQPSIDTLQKIAETFSVSTDYLIGIEHQKFLDVTGLTMEQIAHLQNIINDLKSVNLSNTNL